MKTVAIIQARLGSSRLPAKVLLPLPTGRTVLEEVLHRCKQIEGVDEVILAVPDDAPLNDRGSADWKILGPIGKAAGVKVHGWRGPENDVLGRYASAARAAQADIVIRITADCPLLNPELCSEMLAKFKSHGVNFLSNAYPVREVPHGWDCEIFTADLLYRANTDATLPDNREHVTLWMKDGFRMGFGGVVGMTWKQMEDQSDKRWTLDTLEDYRRIWDLMKNDVGSNPLAA